MSQESSDKWNDRQKIFARKEHNLQCFDPMFRSSRSGLHDKVVVNSPQVQYTDDYIHSQYPYDTVKVTREGEILKAEPQRRMYSFRTRSNVPKLGVMLVGLAGNNGSTLVAGTIANRQGISWRTKTGVQKSNYYGSITQCSTVRLGSDQDGNDVWIPLCNLVPMVNPNDIEFGG